MHGRSISTHVPPPLSILVTSVGQNPKSASDGQAVLPILASPRLTKPIQLSERPPFLQSPLPALLKNPRDEESVFFD